MQLKINKINKIINGNIILNNFSLSVKSGEIAILLGKSGAGKTTILRILNDLETPETGEIQLDNISIEAYQDKKIGIIFQNFNLFSNLSVLENITLGLMQVKKIHKEEAVAIAIDMLKKYNLLEKKDHSIQSLSGGQKQKIAIIRTLVMQPKIICFDEPISALDPYSTNDVLSCIKELQKENYIIIMTTHNVSILNQLNSSIHVLENGSIIESTNSNLFFHTDHQNKNSYLYKFINGII
jgi:ABC-type polar amino acid transport system ATPase subunit